MYGGRNVETSDEGEEGRVDEMGYVRWYRGYGMANKITMYCERLAVAVAGVTY